MCLFTKCNRNYLVLLMKDSCQKSQHESDETSRYSHQFTEKGRDKRLTLEPYKQLNLEHGKFYTTNDLILKTSGITKTLGNLKNKRAHSTMHITECNVWILFVS